MSAAKEAAKPLPPYVPYKTFRTFTDSLKQGIPSRIDRSVMNTTSGAIQNQLLAALKYLRLIDDHGTPAAQLKRLVTSEGAERQQVLREVIEASYPFFHNDSFSLAHATPAQFDEKLRATGAGGDTVRKCAAFFLAAAKDAEIPVSSRITSAPRPRAQRVARSRTAQSTRRTGPQLEPVTQPTQQTLPGNEFQPTTQSKTVRLPSGGTVTLTIAVDWLEISEEETAYLLSLRQTLREFPEQEADPEDEQDDDE
jgi:hypothetical protein